jgi:hypothetical protein
VTVSIVNSYYLVVEKVEVGGRKSEGSAVGEVEVLVDMSHERTAMHSPHE